MSRKARKYNFELLLEGISGPSDKVEDALYKAGCDDALLHFRDRIAFLEFDRTAGSFEEAVLSAIKDVETAGVGVVVARVAPGDIVTASEIARRAECTKEYIRLLKQGKRGPKDFPIPYSSTSTTFFWSWAEVSRWLYNHKKLKDREPVDNAQFLKDINEALEVRENKASYFTRKSLLKKLPPLPAEVRENKKPRRGEKQ